jgi:hypothetical protein
MLIRGIILDLMRPSNVSYAVAASHGSLAACLQAQKGTVGGPEQYRTRTPRLGLEAQGMRDPSHRLRSMISERSAGSQPSGRARLNIGASGRPKLVSY